MAKVKLDQKIPMKVFGGISSQIRAEGIHVISAAKFRLGPIKPEDVRGKVISAFNLGAKIALDVEPAVSKESRFEQLDGVFYLVVP